MRWTHLSRRYIFAALIFMVGVIMGVIEMLKTVR